MKEAPDGWPRITPTLYYDDATAAIDWLCRVFDFEVRLKVEGIQGELLHSELVMGDGVIMVGQAAKRPHCRSPRVAGGNTQSLMVYVDDADAFCEHVRQGGGRIATEPTSTDYGEEYWSDRSFEAVDCGGHHWWFVERLATPRAGWSSVRGKVDKHEGDA